MHTASSFTSLDRTLIPWSLPDSSSEETDGHAGCLNTTQMFRSLLKVVAFRSWNEHPKIVDHLWAGTWRLSLQTAIQVSGKQLLPRTCHYKWTKTRTMFLNIVFPRSLLVLHTSKGCRFTHLGQFLLLCSCQHKSFLMVIWQPFSFLAQKHIFLTQFHLFFSISKWRCINIWQRWQEIQTFYFLSRILGILIRKKVSIFLKNGFL